MLFVAVLSKPAPTPTCGTARCQAMCCAAPGAPPPLCTHACAASQTAALQQLHTGMQQTPLQQLAQLMPAFGLLYRSMLLLPLVTRRQQDTMSRSTTTRQLHCCAPTATHLARQQNMPQTKPADADCICVLMYVEALPSCHTPHGSLGAAIAVLQRSQHNKTCDRATTHRCQYCPINAAAIQLSCMALVMTHTHNLS
jgi:hypothetical protein